MENKKNEEELLEEQVAPSESNFSEEISPEQEKPVRKKIQWTKKNVTKLVLAIVAGVLVLSLVAGILVLALRENDVYYKSKYEVSDFWGSVTHDQVVATMGDYKLTNGQLQVYFWMQLYDYIEMFVENYGDYATYYLGIDLDKPLSEQIYNKETGMTWEQYFIEDALFAWHRYQAMADEAKKNNYMLPLDYQKSFAEMRSTLEETAKEGKYESVDAMLQAKLGANVTYEDYYSYLETYYTANLYFQEVISKLVFTKAELEAFFEENKEMFEQYGVTKESGNLVDFRNIQVKPVGTKDDKGNTVYTDDAWETCRKKAQDIIDNWLAGGPTEESFAALAKLKSEDTTSSSNGGLYQYLAKNDLATVDVRHILIIPEGGTKNESGTSVTYSEEEWEACRQAAQVILDQYLAGEKTEAAFGELANKHSDDQGGKVTNGGLYADVQTGDMVKEFEEWIFDGSRQSGDTGLVRTQYGYHVMYFVKRDGPIDDWAFAEGRKAGDHTLIKLDDSYQILYYVGDAVAWETYARDGLASQTRENLMQSYAAARPIEKNYWAIAIGAIPTTES